MRPDLYFSVDVETDGPIPGEYSMLSIGLCVAGLFDGKDFKIINPDEYTFYKELKPISENWIDKNLEITGFDREELLKTGEHPEAVMSEANQWINDLSQEFKARPVYVAYPLSFDWSFTHYYFERFLKEDPFGFSGCLDMKTIYATKTNSTRDYTSKDHMPSHLFESKYTLTHNALDDAKLQAEFFQNLHRWTP